MSEQVTYELAAVRWRRSQTIDIVTRVGNQIAVFPLSFLRSCGDNTWQYVLYVVNLLVDQIRGHPGRIVITDDVHAIDDALPVDLQSSPTAGTFCYIQDGWSRAICLSQRSFGYLYLIPHAETCHAGIDREPTLSWGPEYSSRFKTPQFLPGSSTNSASSRTTGRPEQVRFPVSRQIPSDPN
jgi:hypothetical protein